MNRNFNPKRKLTFNEKEKAIEMKARIIREQNALCAHCNKPLVIPVEIAHRIPKYNMYVKKYGWDIINHRFNLRATHKDCNSAVLLDPKANPIEADELIKEIQEDLKWNY